MGSGIVEGRKVEGMEDNGAISQVTSAMTWRLKSLEAISSGVKKAGARLSQ